MSQHDEWREEWSSETLGWFLMFEQRPDLHALAGLSGEDYSGAIRRHFAPLFAKLGQMLPPGVRIVSRQEFVGSACIVGDEHSCCALKKLVEQAGLATMVENALCIRPAMRVM